MPSFAPRAGVLLVTCLVVLAVLLTPVRASADPREPSGTATARSGALEGPLRGDPG